MPATHSPKSSTAPLLHAEAIPQSSHHTSQQKATGRQVLDTDTLMDKDATDQWIQSQGITLTPDTLIPDDPWHQPLGKLEKNLDVNNRHLEVHQPGAFREWTILAPLIQSYQALAPTCSLLAFWLARLRCSTTSLAEVERERDMFSHEISTLPVTGLGKHRENPALADDADDNVIQALCLLLERRFDPDRLRGFMEAPHVGTEGWRPPPFYWQLMRMPSTAKALKNLGRKDRRSEFLLAFNEDLLAIESQTKRNWKVSMDSELGRITSNFTIFSRALAEVIFDFLTKNETAHLDLADTQDNMFRLLCHTENAYLYSQAALNFLPHWRPDLLGCRRLSQSLYRYVREVRSDPKVADVGLRFSGLGNFPALHRAFVTLQQHDGPTPLPHDEICSLSDAVRRVLEVFDRYQTFLYARECKTRPIDSHTLNSRPPYSQQPKQNETNPEPICPSEALEQDLVYFSDQNRDMSSIDVSSVSIGSHRDSTKTLSLHSQQDRLRKRARDADEPLSNYIPSPKLFKGNPPISNFHRASSLQDQDTNANATSLDYLDDGANEENEDAWTVDVPPASQAGDLWKAEYHRLRYAPETCPLQALRSSTLFESLLRDFTSPHVAFMGPALPKTIELLLSLGTLSAYEVLCQQEELSQIPQPVLEAQGIPNSLSLLDAAFDAHHAVTDAKSLPCHWTTQGAYDDEEEEDDDDGVIAADDVGEGDGNNDTPLFVDDFDAMANDNIPYSSSEKGSFYAPPFPDPSTVETTFQMGCTGSKQYHPQYPSSHPSLASPEELSPNHEGYTSPQEDGCDDRLSRISVATIRIGENQTESVHNGRGKGFLRHHPHQHPHHRRLDRQTHHHTSLQNFFTMEDIQDDASCVTLSSQQQSPSSTSHSTPQFRVESTAEGNRSSGLPDSTQRNSTSRIKDAVAAPLIRDTPTPCSPNGSTSHSSTSSLFHPSTPSQSSSTSLPDSPHSSSRSQISEPDASRSSCCDSGCGESWTNTAWQQTSQTHTVPDTFPVPQGTSFSPPASPLPLSPVSNGKGYSYYKSRIPMASSGVFSETATLPQPSHTSPDPIPSSSPTHNDISGLLNLKTPLSKWLGSETASWDPQASTPHAILSPHSVSSTFSPSPLCSSVGSACMANETTTHHNYQLSPDPTSLPPLSFLQQRKRSITSLSVTEKHNLLSTDDVPQNYASFPPPVSPRNEDAESMETPRPTLTFTNFHRPIALSLQRVANPSSGSTVSSCTTTLILEAKSSTSPHSGPWATTHDDPLAETASTILGDLEDMKSTVDSDIFQDPQGHHKIGLPRSCNITDPRLRRTRKLFRLLQRDVTRYKEMGRKELFEIYDIIRDPLLPTLEARLVRLLQCTESLIGASATLSYIEHEVIFSDDEERDPLLALSPVVLTCLVVSTTPSPKKLCSFRMCTYRIPLTSERLHTSSQKKYRSHIPASSFHTPPHLSVEHTQQAHNTSKLDPWLSVSLSACLCQVGAFRNPMVSFATFDPPVLATHSSLPQTQQAKHWVFAFLMWFLGAGFYAAVFSFLHSHMSHVDRALLRRHLEIIVEYCRPPYSFSFSAALLRLFRELVLIQKPLNFHDAINSPLKKLILTSLDQIMRSWAPEDPPPETVTEIHQIRKELSTAHDSLPFETFPSSYFLNKNHSVPS